MTQRSRCGPGSSSPQWTASQVTSAIDSIETVYTFSFTVDWFHTVHEVAETSVPAAAARSRPQRTGTMVRSQRSATRNQSAAETAPPKAAKRLMRLAYSPARGSRPQV